MSQTATPPQTATATETAPTSETYTTPFNDVLEAAERPDIDAMQDIVAILSRRVLARKREELVASVREARREFEAGGGKIATPEEIMREAMS